MATNSASGGGNGFFSNIVTGVQSAASSLSSAANQILPVWSQFTLAKQSKDQLNNPTVNQSALPNNLNGIGAAIKANPFMTALVIGGAILAAVVVLKLIKR